MLADRLQASLLWLQWQTAKLTERTAELVDELEREGR